MKRNGSAPSRPTSTLPLDVRRPLLLRLCLAVVPSTMGVCAGAVVSGPLGAFWIGMGIVILGGCVSGVALFIVRRKIASALTSHASAGG
jgi:hypothetical protein